LTSAFLALRFLHMTAAIVFVGGLFARQVVRSLAGQARHVSVIVTLSQAAGRVERWMVIPGNVLTIIFGLALAVITRAPILGGVLGASRNWLLASILILLALLPLVPLVFLPRGKVFERALQTAVAQDVITDDLRASIADPVVRWAHVAEMVGLLVIVFLMVYKPF
jgi:uncharacterized membrane protein